MFSTWFQDLQLLKLLAHNEREDCNEIWEYKVVLLYPTNVQTNMAKVTRCKLATGAARQFYSTSFNSTEADLSSINHAVQSDPTIMVIGHPVGKGEDHVKKSIFGCADSVAISCITFQNGIGDETGSLLVLWLLIAESKAQKPSFTASWQWQGFGRLMLIMLIKQSTSLLLSHNGLLHCQDRLPGVDVYYSAPTRPPCECIVNKHGSGGRSPLLVSTC
jgi:hypothetical protein